MNIASVIGYSSSVVAAGVAGWFAWLAKKAQANSPESVAGGYSRLVGDMRTQQDALMRRVEELEAARSEDRARLVLLSRQVDWLLGQVTPAQKAEFDERFAGPREAR